MRPREPDGSFAFAKHTAKHSVCFWLCLAEQTCLQTDRWLNASPVQCTASIRQCLLDSIYFKNVQHGVRKFYCED